MNIETSTIRTDDEGRVVSVTYDDRPRPRLVTVVRRPQGIGSMAGVTWVSGFECGPFVSSDPPRHTLHLWFWWAAFRVSWPAVSRRHWRRVMTELYGPDAFLWQRSPATDA